MYTLKEAKHFLDISHESYLRRLIGEGKIKATKKAGAWFIDGDEITRIINMKKDKYDQER